MPKIRPLTDTQRMSNFLVYIKGKRTAKEMCDIIGAKSPQTWYNRVNNPNNLMYGEIKALCAYFGLSIEKFMKGEFSDETIRLRT